MAMDFKTAFDPFRAARHGIACLKLEPGPVVVGGFLLGMLNACQSGGSGRFPSGNGGMGDMGNMGAVLILALAGVGLCVGLVVLLAKSFLEPGLLRVGQRLTVDGACELDVLFSGKDAWLSLLGYRLLTFVIIIGVLMVTLLPGGLVVGLAFVQAHGGDPNMLLVIAGATVCVLIGLPALLYVTLGLQLGVYAISIDTMSTMEALDYSWTSSSGNRLSLLWFNIVAGAASLTAVFVGLLTCCIGLIVTMPVTTGTIYCAQANAYLAFSREDFEDFALAKQIGAT